MSPKMLSESALTAWIDSLIPEQKVIGVRAVVSNGEERFAFEPLSNASELRLDYDVTVLPPKKFFLPQTEVLMKFDGPENIENVLNDEPFILIGVHPYDMVAINQMDAVFSDSNYDVHYMRRRQNATIIACDVQRPSENVFAGCMGTATVEEGFDILLTKLGDQYIADARTEKGKNLLGRAENAGEATDEDVRARQQVWENNKKQLKKHELKCEPLNLPELLESSESHPVWGEKSALCFSCGSCNLVCPTCYCFDVRDEVDWDLKSGARKRTWDGCMLTDFAVVAGGFNFRDDRAARFRHRYYRKGKYLWDRMKQIACVGCGRCISACVAKIANPVEVYNTLLEARS